MVSHCLYKCERGLAGLPEQKNKYINNNNKHSQLYGPVFKLTIFKVKNCGVSTFYIFRIIDTVAIGGKGLGVC